MSPGVAAMFSILKFTAMLRLICLLLQYSSAYELQETIHTLKEENFHLQHRLENLTRALRDLRHLMTEHAKAPQGDYDPAYVHAWREWSQSGISAETHHMLEQALCLTELHDAARLNYFSPGFLIFSSFLFVVLTMLP